MQCARLVKSRRVGLVGLGRLTLTQKATGSNPVRDTSGRDRARIPGEQIHVALENVVQGPVVYWLAYESFTLRDRVQFPAGLPSLLGLTGQA